MSSIVAGPKPNRGQMAAQNVDGLVSARLGALQLQVFQMQANLQVVYQENDDLRSRLAAAEAKIADMEKSAAQIQSDRGAHG